MISISLVIIGLIIHSIQPSLIESRLNNQIESQYSDHIQIKRLFPSSYTMHIEGTILKNNSICFLNESMYLQFQANEITHEDLISIFPINFMDDQNQSCKYFQVSYQFHENEDINFYIVIINNYYNNIEIIQLFFTIIPPTYDIGIIFLIIGSILGMTMLIYSLVGWKRYFSIGITINLTVFFARIISIADFPDILSQIYLGLENSHLKFIFSPEMYIDYKFYTISWIQSLLNGALPYSGLFNHQLPPLYVYTLDIFALLPLPNWKMAIPIFLAHIATGYVIFLIGKKIMNNEQNAARNMLFYLINPLSLVYISYCWLNPSIFVFFLVLSFYLMLKSNENIRIFKYNILSNDLAIITLAISTMYKQFTVIFFPLFLLMILHQQKITLIKDIFKLGIRAVSIYIVTILLILLPVILIDFNGFIFSQFQGITNENMMMDLIQIIDDVGTSILTPLITFGVPNNILLILAYFIVYYVLLGGFTLIIYIAYWKGNKIKNQQQNFQDKYNFFKQAIFWALLLSFSLQLFYPRGSYKYYLILITPFIALLLNLPNILSSQSNFSNKKENTVNDDYYILKNWILNYFLLLFIFFCSRYVYGLILIAWSIFLLKKKLKEQLRISNIFNNP